MHTTPEFVRQRRQIGETVRALLTVEQRLDALQAELERAQKQHSPASASHSPESPLDFDNEGHDATYWQRRLAVVRDRLRQAQAQRRDILTRLAAAAGSGERAAAGQARVILEQAEVLSQVEQEIDAAEAALETVQQEALRAGAPAAVAAISLSHCSYTHLGIDRRQGIINTVRDEARSLLELFFPEGRITG